MLINELEVQLKNIIHSDGNESEKTQAAAHLISVVKGMSLIKLKMGFFSRNYHDENTTAHKKLIALEQYLFKPKAHYSGSAPFTSAVITLKNSFYNPVQANTTLQYPLPKTNKSSEAKRDDGSESGEDEMVYHKYGTFNLI